MTPENSVRELAKRLRAGGWDLRAPQELADMIASWLDNIAAPAPAGSRKSREELLADLESARQRAIDAGIEFRTLEEIRAEVERNRSATPQPEQGAGLPEPVGYQSRQKNALSVGATYRSKQEAAECNLHDDEIDELIPLYTEQQMLAALARQQSRVVDEDALDRAVAAWFAVPMSELELQPASVERRKRYWRIRMQAALRAALEGGRDGR